MIQDSSPHLYHVLRRLFPANLLPLFEHVFDFSCSNGGSLEVDFSRPDAASYNPRLARIPLIMLKEASVFDPAPIAASILATAEEPLKCFPSLDCGALSQEVRALVQSVPSKAENIIDISHRIFTKDVSDQEKLPIIIALSLWLDRFRHFHQATPNHISSNKREILNAANSCNLIAERLDSPLAPIIRETARRLVTKYS